jgi:hypothetical protein
MMPAPPPPGLKLGAIRPADAIGVFQQRKLLRPSFRWQDVWQEEHTRAFAVAGVLRLDVLQAIRSQLDAAIEAGTDFGRFHAALRSELVRLGFWGDIEITDPATGELRTTRFDQRRLALIYDVNMRQSHAAGRWARAMRAKEMPYLVYRTMDDERVRREHRAWNWVVLPKEHPWWHTHYPPNGWRCRCHAYAIDDAGIRALLAAGKPIKREPPKVEWIEWLNKSTGRVERVPRGIDPGFAYNPGRVHVQHMAEQLVQQVQAIQPVRAPGGGANPAAATALAGMRAVVARGRAERAFRDFLREPPIVRDRERDVGLPVAALPAPAGEPAVASVSAYELGRQAKTADVPRLLPAAAAGWALAQAVVDQGQRLELGAGRVIWWWERGSGDARRVHVLELERGMLTWWVRALVTLTEGEARQQYPLLDGLLG